MMAKATVVRGEAPIVGVTLELTGEEASFLRTLVGGHVCGSGDRYQFSDQIFDALENAGVPIRPDWAGKGTVTFS
jgi:hypothetical protein